MEGHQFVEQNIDGVERVIAGAGCVVGIDRSLETLFQAAAHEVGKTVFLRHGPALRGGAPQKGQDQVRMGVDPGRHEKALYVRPDDDLSRGGSGLDVKHLGGGADHLEGEGRQLPQPDISFAVEPLGFNLESDEFVGQDGQNQDGQEYKHPKGFFGVPLKNIFPLTLARF